MSTAHQEHLEALSRDIAGNVVAIEEVVLVTLMGSVALGLADECSDIDIFAVYVNEPRLDDIHHALSLGLAQTSADKFWLDTEKFSIPFKADDVSGSIIFMQQSWYEDRIARYPDITLEEYKQLAFCVREAKYLAGDKDMYEKWTSKISGIPKNIKDTTITANMASLRNFFVQQRLLPSIEREDWLFINRLCTKGVRWLLEVVFLLNDTSYASPKLARKRLEHMTLKPRDFVGRLEKVVEGVNVRESVVERMEILAELTGEVEGIIQNNMYEIVE